MEELGYSFALPPLSFSFSVVFCSFFSSDLISLPKLSVSNLSSAKCADPKTIRFLLLHSCSTLPLNSNSNHLACHRCSFGNMVGWAASCSGGICWAPDISVLGTHKELSSEKRKKLLNDFQTAEKMILYKVFRRT